MSFYRKNNKRVVNKRIAKPRLGIYFPDAERYLRALEGLALFYPCSGQDFYVPIRIFSPYITDFWFVDVLYFSDHQFPADKVTPVLERSPCYRRNYRLISVSIDGPVHWRCQGNIEPCVRTEEYEHIPTGRRIRVHRRRGYGFSALRKDERIGKLGVFFYRGDSHGESGSGNWWLHPDHLDEIFDRLVDGGLLVLDGSDGGYPYFGKGGKRAKKYQHLYSQIRKYTCNYEINKTPEEIIKSMEVVTDPEGRVWRCIGCAGMRYGPTLIWYVKKS